MEWAKLLLGWSIAALLVIIIIQLDALTSKVQSINETTLDHYLADTIGNR